LLWDWVEVQRLRVMGDVCGGGEERGRDLMGFEKL
jgi:hypothetical protein